MAAAAVELLQNQLWLLHIVPFVTMCDYLHLIVSAGTPIHLHSVDHAAVTVQQ